MKKSQWLLISAVVVAVAGLYFFGDQVGPGPARSAETASDSAAFNIESYKTAALNSLPQGARSYLSSLDSQMNGKGSQADRAGAASRLAAYWKDTVGNPPLHLYYLSAASELVNTEKSLTFAAHSILAYLPYSAASGEQVWLANQGKHLFDQALAINPSNDSTIIGLGGCIMYGATSSEGPMAGILKVREVAEKDSSNLFAQYMLGVGGMVSRQYDKAAERFRKVAQAQPDNLEVWFKLAEAYEQAGNTADAIACYETIDKKVNIPELKKEIANRIGQLKARKEGTPK